MKKLAEELVEYTKVVGNHNQHIQAVAVDLLDKINKADERKAVNVDVYDNGIVEIAYNDGKKQVSRCVYHDAFLENLDPADFVIH